VFGPEAGQLVVSEVVALLHKARAAAVASGGMTTTALPTEADVAAAARRIKPYVRRTPLLDVSVDGQPVVFKLEHLQLTGSFKPRGALNALLLGPRPELVVTASGGNHGLAVATAAHLLDLPAVVYVPETVPAGKARRIEAAGARLVRVGTRYADAAAAARPPLLLPAAVICRPMTTSM